MYFLMLCMKRFQIVVNLCESPPRRLAPNGSVWRWRLLSCSAVCLLYKLLPNASITDRSVSVTFIDHNYAVMLNSDQDKRRSVRLWFVIQPREEVNGRCMTSSRLFLVKLNTSSFYNRFYFFLLYKYIMLVVMWQFCTTTE